MNFVSILFFLALLPIGILFYTLPRRFRAYFILIVSLGFYALAQPYYLLLLVGSTLCIYWCGLKISQIPDETSKRLFLAIGVGFIVSLIIAFKAAGALTGFLMPLGISYYSFKLISYLIEVYWEEEQVETDFSNLLIYSSFFPQIICGPIQRSDDFFKQLKNSIGSSADPELIESGYRLILGGLMLKLLLGDRIASFIETIDKSPSDYSWSVLVITAFSYTLQLYADFAAYTNIALGVGKLFVITGPENFDAPFSATNIQHMWQRWHMSLTSWLNDYLFMPLNMSLRSLGQLGLILSIMINMTVIGLWHGLSLNYLVYGLLHALFIVVTVVTSGLRNSIFGISMFTKRFAAILGVISTFCLMSFSQIFFYAGSWPAAVEHLDLIFGSKEAGELGFSQIQGNTLIPAIFSMIVVFYIGLGAPGIGSVKRGISRFIPNYIQYGIAILLISAFSLEAGISFIYGQF